MILSLLFLLTFLFCVKDENHTLLGKLTNVIETGANDVYEVSMTDGREVLIPAIKECILEVNVEEGYMTVHLLDGLLD